MDLYANHSAQIIKITLHYWNACITEMTQNYYWAS